LGGIDQGPEPVQFDAATREEKRKTERRRERDAGDIFVWIMNES